MCLSRKVEATTEPYMTVLHLKQLRWDVHSLLRLYWRQPYPRVQIVISVMELLTVISDWP